MRQLKITKQLTQRGSKSIDLYLSNVSKEKMITADEEVELAKRIKQGDERALNKLVKANLRFVISVAKQYQGNGLTLEDLIAEGNIGLITAAKRFDETKGFKFISYAVWWIRQSIMQAIAEHSRVVRLPLNKVSAIQKVARKASELEQQHERMPTAEELSELLEMPEDLVKDLLKYSQKQISVDAPMTQDDDEKNNLLNILPSESNYAPNSKLIHESLQQDIESVLSKMKTREAEIIRMSFGLNGYPPMTLDEISSHMELTRERIRQIREKALRILRRDIATRKLKQYL
ncbi:MAG: RNA polymerase sigma factor RpoD/SigA [Bacteroidetes bacterium]|nr:MAG: RNA polymerase sigma factor RpoD/SigA [Bacteroidota bacterium]